MREKLLKRMDHIGRSVATHEGSAMLLALGSIGLETERLDDYSDLDFFLIVDTGYKNHFIKDLSWLAVSPVTYQFQNTRDGYKIMYDDGIYGEFAVFETEELSSIAYSKGRIIWKRDDVSAKYATPLHRAQRFDHTYLFEEALTNIYVGLLREHRGERLAGVQMITAAVDNVLKTFETEGDLFNPTRRVETRHPEMIPHLKKWMRGYGHSVEAAKDILRYIEARHSVNETLKREIERLLEA